MPDRATATQSSHRQEPAGGGYFAPLGTARYLLLTTFKRVGSPVSAPVQGLVDGDRAYFRAGSRSGTVKRLRHTDAVQVAPCSVLGLCSFGPPVDATARLLPGDEAGPVAGKLARKYQARHRFLGAVLQRTRRRQMVHYELLPCDAGGDHAMD